MTMKAHRAGRLFLKGLGLAGLMVLLLSMTSFGQVSKPVVSCESLAKLALPDTTITMAKEYAAGEYKAPAPRFGAPPGAPGARGGTPATMPARGSAEGARGEGQPGGGRGGSLLLNSLGYISGPIPAFCRVTATVKTSSESTIGIDVVLPASGWNGKMIAVGGGGGIGDIGGLSSFARGYAFANPSEMPGPNMEAGKSPDKATDFAYRAVHLTTVLAKEIIKAYYGSAPKLSYWFGHSAGGYQGLQEAARYPKDFDGIGIGWPPNPAALFNATQLWPDWLIAHNPSMLIPHEKYPMIHQAVLDACDELDGVKDGMLTEPTTCQFQPESLLCKGGMAPNA
jgi:feruloyl esterase